MLIPETAACLSCGYSLRGLPRPVCPECGRSFDPANPRSYRDTSSPAAWQLWAKPPSWMHIGVCIAVSSYLVIARSSPITNLDPLPIPACCLGFLLLPFLVGSYLVQGISFWVSTRTAARRNRWRWAVLPVCLLLVASTFAGNWPLRLRFAFSRSAFEREAKNLLASSQIGETRHGRFVGLYYVEIIRVDPATSSVYFLTGEVGLIDRVGFVYSPYFPQKFGQYLSPPWYGYED